ncbi:MAG: hypothetical protein Q9181_003066 [Wetmoreana brouardii]
MLESFKASKSGRLLDQARSRFREIGNTYSATIAGTTVVYTIEPSNIKTIFAGKFDDFDIGWWRRRAFAPAFEDVLITVDGPTWYHQRAMLRPAFNIQQFSDYAFYEPDIDSLIHRIPKDGSTIDMAPLFNTHALSMASRLLFDEPLASLNPDFSASSTRFIEAIHRVNKGIQLTGRWGKLALLQPRDRAFEAGCKTIHDLGDILVQKALSYRKSWKMQTVDRSGENQNRYIFLQELAKEIDNPVKLRNQLLAMLIVGSQTTATLLTSCLSLLSSRPDLWAKLRGEAITLGLPSSETVRAFTFLNHVVNEGLSHSLLLLEHWTEGN